MQDFIVEIEGKTECSRVRDSALADAVRRCSNCGILPAPADFLRESLERTGGRWVLKNAISAVHAAAAPRRPHISSPPASIAVTVTADSVLLDKAAAESAEALCPEKCGATVFLASIIATGPPQPKWREGAEPILRAIAVAASEAVPAQGDIIGASSTSPATRAELECAAACATRYSPLILQCARKGVPPSQRHTVWSVAAATWQAAAGDTSASAAPSGQVALEDASPVAQIIRRDIASHAGNSAEYFPATDMVEALLFRLASDEHARRTAPVSCGDMRLAPVSGFSCLVCPLFFVFSSVDDAYTVLLWLYNSHLWKLLTVNDDGEGLPCLAGIFLEIVGRRAPKAVARLSELKLSPLSAALEWLRSAFVGFLPVRQVMLLWDRIFAFDTLIVLPLVSAMIFVSKEPAVVAAPSAKAVQKILSDLENVDISALLRSATDILQ